MSYHQGRVATKLSLVQEQLPLKKANSVTVAQVDRERPRVYDLFVSHFGVQLFVIVLSKPSLLKRLFLVFRTKTLIVSIVYCQPQ